MRLVRSDRQTLDLDDVVLQLEFSCIRSILGGSRPASYSLSIDSKYTAPKRALFAYNNRETAGVVQSQETKRPHADFAFSRSVLRSAFRVPVPVPVPVPAVV